MMASSPTPVCPFYAGQMITDAQFFVGRQDEIRFILQNLTGAQPTSVNLVGDRRFGKSSLLYHIYQTYEDRVTGYGRQPQDFVVVYVSLRDGNCRSPEQFYQAIAAALMQRQRVQAHPALVQPLQGPLDPASFFRAMAAWQQAEVLPVICLDDFEELLDRTSPFDDGFYDNLRSLENRSQIMLIIASRRRLRDYKRHGRTSAFFNVSQTWRLGELNEGDRRDVVRLADRQHPGQPALNPERQELALKWAGGQPYLLQLAGKYLWEAMQAHRPDGWALRRFEEDAGGVRQRFHLGRMLLFGITRVGRWGQGVGDAVDDWGNFVKGMMTLVLLGLLLCGAMNWREGLKYVQMTLNDVLKNADTQPEGK